MSTGAAAQSPGWEFEARVYLWGTEMMAMTATGQDADLSFGDILETLDFALMGGLEARNGRWSFLGDLQYLELSEDLNMAVGPGIPATADADMDGLIFTGAVGYDAVQTESYRLTPFAGFRYLDVNATANLTVGGGSARVSTDRTNFDGILGVRGGTQLSDRWRLSFYADVGTGDSDLTWQLAGTLDYEINETWTLSVGYRHLAWEFDDPVVLRDVSLSGPIIGTRIKF
jgi:hypothetical protein